MTAQDLETAIARWGLTRPDAAARLGISRRTLFRLLASDEELPLLFELATEALDSRLNQRGQP